MATLLFKEIGVATFLFNGIAVATSLFKQVRAVTFLFSGIAVATPLFKQVRVITFLFNGIGLCWRRLRRSFCGVASPLQRDWGVRVPFQRLEESPSSSS